MALRKKSGQKKQDDEREQPDELLVVLRELRDEIAKLNELATRIPSPSDQIFLAALTGAIAKRGPMDGNGGPSVGLVNVARQFANSID